MTGATDPPFKLTTLEKLQLLDRAFSTRRGTRTLYKFSGLPSPFVLALTKNGRIAQFTARIDLLLRVGERLDGKGAT